MMPWAWTLHRCEARTSVLVQAEHSECFPWQRPVEHGLRRRGKEQTALPWTRLCQAGLICTAAPDTAETDTGLLGQLPLISQVREPDWSQHISQPPGNGGQASRALSPLAAVSRTDSWRAEQPLALLTGKGPGPECQRPPPLAGETDPGAQPGAPGPGQSLCVLQQPGS